MNKHIFTISMLIGVLGWVGDYNYTAISGMMTAFISLFMPSFAEVREIKRDANVATGEGVKK